MDSSRPPAPPVTLDDVARAVGVHLSTVSLALRGSPKIAAATARRIRAAAERLGYRQDPVNFALSRRRLGAQMAKPRLIFLTNRDSWEDFHRVAHMPRFLAAAQNEAERCGYVCEAKLVRDCARDPAAMAGEFDRSGVQGIILAAFMPYLPSIELPWRRYGIVKIDTAFMAPEAAQVSYDQRQIVEAACQRLHALGYRRLGLAIGHADEQSSRQLFGIAYTLKQHLLGLPVIPPLHFMPHESYRQSTDRLAKWVRRHRIEAVMSNWTHLDRLLAAAGFRVPDDVACAGLCLHDPDSFLAGSVMSHETVGRRAVEMLALQIRSRRLGPQPHPPTVYIAGSWHDGASAPARARPAAG